MKHVFLAFVLLNAVVSAAQTTIDPTASKVLWTATKVTGQHSGAVPVAAGHIVVVDGALRSAEISMDMTGINCLDIEDGTFNNKLVAHLKGPDFFAVAQFPTASFRSTGVDPIPGAKPGQPNIRVSGELTIKGISHPKAFDCIFWLDKGVARAAATFTFDRTLYDVKYRSGTIFPDLGDKAIADEVSLTFDITAR